jgi:hypothetical protein
MVDCFFCITLSLADLAQYIERYHKIDIVSDDPSWTVDYFFLNSDFAPWNYPTGPNTNALSPIFNS